jgi:hypothetical protein
LVLLLAAVASSVPAGYFYSSPYLSGYPYLGLNRYAHYGYGALPVVRTVPVVKTVAVPAPGYVAETPGSLHTAPLPVGPSGDGFYASHHINTAKAAGTK